ARPAGESKAVRYIVIGLLVAIVCAFAGVVRCDFIDLDDRGHVLENPLVRAGLSWPGVKEAFTTPHASLWVPLTWISFMADVSLVDFWPLQRHKRESWLRLALEKIPLVALALFAAWMQMRAIHARGQTVPIELLPLAVRASNAVTSYAIYLGDLVWPARLGVF